MNALMSKLRRFKLSGIHNSLNERLSYAQDKSLSYVEFLELLLEDEFNNRSNNSYKKRYAKAKLPAYKIIEDFDFSFQASIDKKAVNDAMTCNFIQEKKNIVFIGNPGTGKTHLSIAIGINALKKGHKILFTSKTFEQWGDIFTDSILASAILDRIVHYSVIFKINGNSYRSRNLKKGGYTV